ncbi:ATP synthase epsilon chain, sodium ion specific [Pirellula sp. SH-Sr6A]|uniref:FoF1 ATP synthase subunit delta/epsilon n=1 Tax=Pirellula sp. SH-Sr6A TaxID=1632865 RepID=UPI00078EE7E9|nr:F0F1 ATP synthase subunit epsilon [Pirellula sp. SH-Sr6A]AMV34719.1 ATP synthase epsilon chain, sodium ion specific [Pirellula sp. SH-Sr6A]
MAETQVRCVVVTPEKTELDTTCDALTLPLYDGEAGILPGRAPMVGRLGFGLLKLRNGSTSTEWFVDGGFVQVTREAVYVLTDRLLKREQIDKKQAEEDLAKATAMKATSPEAISLRERTIAQTRAKSRLAK